LFAEQKNTVEWMEVMRFAFSFPSFLLLDCMVKKGLHITYFNSLKCPFAEDHPKLQFLLSKCVLENNAFQAFELAKTIAFISDTMNSTTIQQGINKTLRQFLFNPEDLTRSDDSHWKLEPLALIESGGMYWTTQIWLGHLVRIEGLGHHPHSTVAARHRFAWMICSAHSQWTAIDSRLAL
jgi:hypothetical protein